MKITVGYECEHVNQAEEWMVTAAKASGSKRAVGSRAGLTLQQIIDAAQFLEPDELTMQALANALGVDRKAINHHVKDRETLLELVAEKSFSESFSASSLPAGAPWQESCRIYATQLADSAIATGALAEHLRVSDGRLASALEFTETVLERMVNAGFSDEYALRIISALASIGLSHARDVVLQARSGLPARTEIVRRGLQDRDTERFETLSRIMTLPTTTYDRKQLDLTIDVFLTGAESLLRSL
jgi:TetR/AcrR family transcriptional regulator, tetracycline repressor protein